MGRVSRHFLECYFAVFRVVDFVASVAEKVADHGPIVRVVVDDQNAVFSHVFDCDGLLLFIVPTGGGKDIRAMNAPLVVVTV